MNTESNTIVKPQKITKAEADKLDDYAQDLNDPVTKVVDYGNLVEDPKRKKKK